MPEGGGFQKWQGLMSIGCYAHCMHRARCLGAPASANRQIFVLLEVMSSAIYSLSIETLPRRKGRNLLQLAAYISNLTLKYWKGRKTFKRKLAEDVRRCELLGTALTPEEFFNRSEKAERRKDANVGRHMIVALPRFDITEPTADNPRPAVAALDACDGDPDTERMMTILRQMAAFLHQLLGVPVFFAYHRPVPGSGKPDNPHGHFVFGPRPWDEETQTFAKNRFRALDAAKTGGPLIELIRLRWEEIVNAGLEPGMKPVSRLSHVRKGDGLIAKRHLGYQVCATERIRPGSTRTAQFNQLVDRRTELAKEIHQLEREEGLLNAEIHQLATADLTPMSAAASRSVATHAILPDAITPISADTSRQQAIAALEDVPTAPGVATSLEMDAPNPSAVKEEIQPESIDPLTPMTAKQNHIQAGETVADEVLRPLYSTQSRAMAAKKSTSDQVYPVTADASRQQAKILGGKNIAGPETEDEKALSYHQPTPAASDPTIALASEPSTKVDELLDTQESSVSAYAAWVGL